MKSVVKIAGLCLVAMFMVSMVVAGTAQAKWERCAKGGSGTKYTEHQCVTASAGGEWSWQEVTGTEEVRIKGSLRLTDTKVPIVGKVSVECSGEGIGDVGPGQHGRVQEVKTNAAQCRNIENCEKVEAVEARDTPWQVEAFDTEGKSLATITEAGKGQPGWNVTCRVLGVTKGDECLTEEHKPESVILRDEFTISVGTFLVGFGWQRLRRAKCSVGGAESGEVSGNGAIETANGWGLRVS